MHWFFNWECLHRKVLSDLVNIKEQFCPKTAAKYKHIYISIKKDNIAFTVLYNIYLKWLQFTLPLIFF